MTGAHCSEFLRVLCLLCLTVSRDPRTATDTGSFYYIYIYYIEFWCTKPKFLYTHFPIMRQQTILTCQDSLLLVRRLLCRCNGMWEMTRTNTKDFCLRWLVTDLLAMCKLGLYAPITQSEFYHFCARQHICYSAYMLSQFCLSCRLAVTRVDQTKTVEARIMKLSPQGSPMTLVFPWWTSPQNSKGNIGSGHAK